MSSLRESILVSHLIRSKSPQNLLIKLNLDSQGLPFSSDFGCFVGEANGSSVLSFSEADLDSISEHDCYCDTSQNPLASALTESPRWHPHTSPIAVHIHHCPRESCPAKVHIQTLTPSYLVISLCPHSKLAPSVYLRQPSGDVWAQVSEFWISKILIN